MPKKKTPRPKVPRCVGCDEAAPVAGARFCADCASDASKRMGQDFLTGEVAKLVWFAKEWGIDVEALLTEALEAKREKQRVEIEDARVGESAARGVTFLRRAKARARFRRLGAAVYNGYRDMGIPWKEAARRVIEDWRVSDGAVFESIDDVKVAAFRLRKPKLR